MIQERLGEYVASLQDNALPPAVSAAEKRVVIDWFAATLPGGILPPATLLVGALAEELGRGGARLYPSNAAAPVRVAAAHTIEFDDIFRDAIYHPGTVVIPAALAATNGALAAMAAEAGVTGAPEMLEGERGFGNAMSDGPDWDAAIADLGSRFTVIETTQKNYASCGHGHAAIDALLNLRAKHQFTPDTIVSIHVGSYWSSVEITNILNPLGLLDCKLSTPYCLAAAMYVGSVRTEAFTEKWVNDPELRSFMSRVQMSVDPETDAAFPKLRGAIVEVETVSGDRHVQRRRTRKGDPDDPLSDDEVYDKYREMACPVIGETASEDLLAALRNLETLDDLTGLPL